MTNKPKTNKWVEKIPKEWICQYGTGDLPQSHLSEKLIRCTKKELIKFITQTQQETLDKVIEIISKQYVDEDNPYTEHMGINDTLDFLVAKVNRLKTIKQRKEEK